MGKPYHLMTAAERTAERIKKNKVIDAKVAEYMKEQWAIRDTPPVNYDPVPYEIGGIQGQLIMIESSEQSMDGDGRVEWSRCVKTEFVHPCGRRWFAGNFTTKDVALEYSAYYATGLLNYSWEKWVESCR